MRNRMRQWLPFVTTAFACMLVSTVTAQEVLISYDEDNIRNGNFIITQAEVDDGTVSNFLDPDRTSRQNPPANNPLNINVARHRALRDIGPDSGDGVNQRGWTMAHDFYMGGNGSVGYDGNFGFAASPFEEGNGISGQAFVNSGIGFLKSEPISQSFAAGTIFDLNYLLGSDTDNGTATVDGFASLLFDEGLPSEFTHEFEETSATGLIDPNDATNVDFNRQFEQYTTASAFESVSVQILIDGFTTNGAGTRTLVDQVELIATTGSILGDFDGDGDVDLADLDEYNGRLGLTIADNAELADLDLDGNGTIELADFQQHYGTLVETSNGGKGTFPGDLNLDGTVDVFGDGFVFLGNVGNAATSWAEGDFNADQQVDIFGDGFLLLNNIGNDNGGAAAAPATSAVPEPGTLSLLALAGIGVVARRRR